MIILSWIKSHKRLTLAIIAGIFLLIIIIIALFQTIKSRFFPEVKTPEQTAIQPQASSAFANMTIKSPKTIYPLSEKIPLSVTANSGGTQIRGFDILLEYDPQFLILTERKPPPLTDFLYFGKNTDSAISISAVQKPDLTNPNVFDTATLAELEFTPKKTGKTSIKIIYAPNSTNESNLINPESRDILGSAQGLELTIQ